MTLIYYFSGTGNTLWSARRIGELIGGQSVLRDLADPATSAVLEAQSLVILFPAYAYGAPPLVQRFLENAVLRVQYVAVLTTYGSSPGGALASISRILRKKDVKQVFFGAIPAVENYIPIFGAQSKRTQKVRLALQVAATERVAAAIAAHQTNHVNEFRPFSRFIAWIFSKARPLLSRFYNVNASCNGCGLCARLCPVHAITMSPNERPQFSARCEQCQRCLNVCPCNAISFARFSTKTPHYLHPSFKCSSE